MDSNLREQSFDELIGMFAQAPIGLCCFDRTLRFVYINDYLATINGISVEEHLGRSIRELIPDVAAGVEEQLRQVIETGESIIGGRSMRKPRPSRDALGRSSTTTMRSNPRPVQL